MTTQQELDDFRAEVSAWLEDNKPADPGFLLPDSFLEVGTDQQFEFLREWQRKVYDAGYLGMAWPKEYGGGGRPQVFQDIATDEMIKQRVPFMTNTIGLNWAGPLILRMGSEEEKQKYIKRMLSAEDIWCQGFSEPDTGSDLGNLQCRATREGEEYVINGSKIWTTLGTHADYMILLARTSSEGPSKYAGISYFLAPMKIPGIEPRPIRKLTGEYGFCQTFFDNARIPADCLMGKEGEGWNLAMITLTFERGADDGGAGGAYGIQPHANDFVELARRARRNGRPAIEDPLVRDQLVQLIIAHQSIQLTEARSKFPALLTEWPNSIPLSGKIRFTEWQRRAFQFSLAMQGANGARFVSNQAIDGGKWQRSYFNAFSYTIGGGTTEIQHNIVGERVLGLPKR